MAEAENRNIEIFEKMPVPDAVHTMVVPTILGQLIILLYSIADSFFVGRTNNPLMAAGASLVLPVFNICTSLAGISGVGGGYPDGFAVCGCIPEFHEEKPHECMKIRLIKIRV